MYTAELINDHESKMKVNNSSVILINCEDISQIYFLNRSYPRGI